VPELTVIWWRDIPAQVTAKEGRARAARELAPRFQEAIDSAAMRAGLIGTDAYLANALRIGSVRSSFQSFNAANVRTPIATQ